MADTIFALATARGRAGLAVVRVSGDQAHEVCAQLSGPLPPVREARLRNIRWRDELLDQAVVVVFAKGASFTGEASVELQLHGGPSVVASVLRALGETGLARPAEAGEFTRRALENGVLDLTQVEGLADLIDAETDQQRRMAVRVLNGEIGRRVGRWRGDLIRAAALLEATIDFAEEDVPVNVVPEVRGLLTGLQRDLCAEIEGAAKAERIRDGFEVAILGAPNAGKSTLLNRLAGRDAAITSDIAGTTRDIIEVRMDIDGLAVTLLDTAGLRQTDDPLEKEGIRRAVMRAKAADLRIFLGPVDLLSPGHEDLLVVSKADIVEDRSGLAVSGLTGLGVDELLARIGQILSAKVAGAGIMARERQKRALERGLRAIRCVLEHLDGPGFLPELAAEDLRQGIRALDSLIGRVDVNDLLGEIFSRFCIGK